MIMLDSVIRVNKKYYPQRLLEECKYEIKKKDHLDPTSSDDSDSESDNKTDNESNKNESDD